MLTPRKFARGVARSAAGLSPILLFALVVAGCGTLASRDRARSPQPAASASSKVRHYEYVFPDQGMYVYDIDHGMRLVQHVSLPGVKGVRGVVASPVTGRLFISYGGDRGRDSRGTLLAYDLPADRVAWRRTYARGIDSMDITPDGAIIYMPDGELSTDGIWSVIDARHGNVVGQIDAGEGPHNTVVSLSGNQVYLGPRNDDHLYVASTATNRIVRRIGPLESGVRPFTINGRDTLAFTTATEFLGFQVSSIITGRVLYTVRLGPRFPYDPSRFAASAPSHGISLAPDERQVWVIDAPNDYVHVFDVSGLPRRAPRRIADIKLLHGFTGDESGCDYDCARDGWLTHSRSGCLVFVGDSGDVISTRTHRIVGFLPPLRDSRKYLEIDWRGGRPVATTSRTGLGYVHRGPLPRPPACP